VTALLGVAAPMALMALTGCDGGSSPTPPASPRLTSPTVPTAPSPVSPAVTTTLPGLDHYTDLGDGCQQAVSAIAYADDVLRALGQEPYQEFDDAVRSRLAAVAGTLALEGKDWPDAAVARQARVVQPLAQAAGEPVEGGPAASRRARTLLRYRIEAGRLVLACRDAVPGPDRS
jgi:hypothetical protein